MGIMIYFSKRLSLTMKRRPSEEKDHTQNSLCPIGQVEKRVEKERRDSEDLSRWELNPGLERSRFWLIDKLTY